MIKFFVRSASVLFCTAVLLAGSGCEALSEAWEEALSGASGSSSGDEAQTRYVITVLGVLKHARGGDLEMEVNTFDGKSIWVNRLPLLSSAHIAEVRLSPSTMKPNFYDLNLILTERGAMLWSQMAARYSDEPVVLMVDGVFQCVFQPRPIQGDSSLVAVIPGPFDPVTAGGIEKFSKKNQSKLNPSPTRPLWE